MDKQELIENIKAWMKIDNELKQLKKEENDRIKKKEEISKRLVQIMSENDIDEFNTKTGKIVYTKRNVKKPITKKMLLNILTKYTEGNVSEAQEISDFIDENREQQIVESIQLKQSKIHIN